MHKHDDLHEFFLPLASDVDAAGEPNPILEKKLMNAMAKHKQGRARLVGRLLAAFWGSLLIGGTVVASGGAQAVMEWFATAKVVNPDGTSRYVEMNEDGFIWLNDTQAIQLGPPEGENMEALRGREIVIPVGLPSEGLGDGSD